MWITFSDWLNADVEPWSRRPGAGLAALALLVWAASLTLDLRARPIRLDDVGETGRVLPPIEMRIDVNASTVDELQNLPRIGPGLAAAIVDDRTRRGSFASLDDLQRVKGIGARTTLLIEPHVVPFTSADADGTEE